MNMKKTKWMLLLMIWFACLPAGMGQRVAKNQREPAAKEADVLIIGGGASGTAASIQAARMGARVLVVEATPWMGGMLTAAGVSAIDGNHQLPSGIWGEFRQKLYDHYGSPAAVETGWVSNTLFEPSVGLQKLRELATVPGLEVWHNANWQAVRREANQWVAQVTYQQKSWVVRAPVLIDATELGDVMAHVGARYEVGMDSRAVSGEEFAPERANDIVQDLTYALTLKDYGPGADKTIPRPEGYDPEPFRCSCDPEGKARISCVQMLNYGKLPNGKYMINWPNCGNDVYLHLIDKTPEEREALLKEAKLESLRFLYFIQHELGFRHLGLADDEFPTADRLPLIPYHREARRLKGLVRLTVSHLAHPFEQAQALYRTGVAVGDYPIDHHHDKNPLAPEIDFINIKVPSYNVPLGALLPANVPGLIVAEKSISVTNIVNGATRLQPVVLGIGQAAGALAALAAKGQTTPDQVPVRKVQEALLSARAYLMPYYDVKPSDPDFAAIQRIGATGILKGFGVPYKWANQTWFYPERELSEYECWQGLRLYYLLEGIHASGAPLTAGFLQAAFATVRPELTPEVVSAQWQSAGMSAPYAAGQKLSRREAARLTDFFLNPFAIPVGHEGEILKNSR